MKRRGEHGLSDRQQRSLDQLDLSLNRAIRRGVLTKEQAEAKYDKAMGRARKRAKDVNFLNPNEAAEFLRTPIGTFPIETQRNSAETIKRWGNPQTIEDRNVVSRVQGLGLDPTSLTASDVFSLMPQSASILPIFDPAKRIKNAKFKSAIKDMEPQEITEYGRALAQAVQAHMAVSETGSWERDGLSDSWSGIFKTDLSEIIGTAADINLDSDEEVYAWIQSIVHGKKNDMNTQPVHKD